VRAGISTHGFDFGLGWLHWFRKVNDIGGFLHPIVADSPVLHRVSRANSNLEGLVHLSIFTWDAVCGRLAHGFAGSVAGDLVLDFAVNGVPVSEFLVEG
jgi:hypothetical protein